VHAHFVGEAAEFARVVASVAGVPWSVTAHAVDLFVPRPTVPELLRAARPAITVCEHHRAYVARTYGVEVAVVRCGVPLEVPRADPGAPGLRVVCVARDVPKKGLDALVDAVRAVPGATLRLVSDATRLAGPGVAVGPLRPSEVPAALAAATLFALPCRIAPNGDRDGIPVALLEAMAAGLPVMSTRVSGVPEVVDDAVGWLIPPDDPQALVAALTAALDPSERARRGEAARARVSGWSIDAQVDGLLAAWRGELH
ncbi:MAG: glycosyltransferase family 4 protein, partial [Myxococcota bacterium]